MMLFLLNVLLALAWAAVTGAFTLANLLFGLLLGWAALWLGRDLWGDQSRYFRRGRLLGGLLLLFLVELVKSSLRVAREVLTPRHRFQSGIIALPLTARRDLEITVLANLITLTPGTLSLDVAADRSVLYVHALDAGEPETVKRDLKQGFERRVLEALR